MGPVVTAIVTFVVSLHPNGYQMHSSYPIIIVENSKFMKMVKCNIDQHSLLLAGCLLDS